MMTFKRDHLAQCRAALPEQAPHGVSLRLRPRRQNVALEVLDRPVPPAIVTFPLSPPPADPERIMAQDQIRLLLDQALDELPLAFRTIAVPRLVERMSVEETAELFDLKPETVKTRLFRARRLLRAALEKRLGPALCETFPFDGARCENMADRVVERLGSGR